MSDLPAASPWAPAGAPAPAENEEEQPSQHRERGEQQHEGERPPAPDPEYRDDAEQQERRQQDERGDAGPDRAPRAEAGTAVAERPAGPVIGAPVVAGAPVRPLLPGPPEGR